MIRRAAASALLACPLATAASGGDPGGAAATRVCDQVAHQIDVIASHRGTLCVPGVATSRKRGLVSFILVAPEPVMSTPKSRSAYATLACAAFGHALNLASNVRAEDVWLSDITAVRERRAYSLRLELCQKLQPKVHDGTISVDEMRVRVADELKPQIIP